MRVVGTLILLFFIVANQNSYGFPKPSVVRLNNGATLVMVQDPSASISSSYVFVRTGSLFESPWMGSGISHYLEHLVAGGTTNYRSENKYKSLVDSLGGASNAYTTYDHTAYYIQSPSNDTSKALNILFEWVTSANWTELEYKREKGVILKEMARANSNVSRQIYQSVQQRYYKDSPYRYPVIGYRDQFLKITSSDLMAYFKTQYVPENFVIVVGGNISREAILKQVENSFGKLPAFASPLRYHAEQKRIISQSTEHIHLKSLKSQRVIIRYPIISFFHEDVYPLDLLAYILGNGDQSLLYNELISKKKWATNININSITPTEDFGYFEISIETEQPIEQIVTFVQEYLDKLGLVELSNLKIEKARTQKRNEYILGKASLDDYIKDLGQAMILGQDPLFFEHYSNQFKEVKAIDIQQVVNTYLTTSKRQVYVFNSPINTKNQHKKIELAQVSATTENGITYIAVPESNEKVFQVSIKLNGGISEDPDDLNGLGYLSSILIGQKIKGMTREKFQGYFESKGTSITASLSNNNLSINLLATKNDQKKLLPLFIDSITEFDVDEAGLDEAKSQLIKSINKISESWFEDAFNQSKKIIFDSSSPYAKPLKGSVKDIERITVNDVKNYVRNRVENNQIVVLIQSNEVSSIKQQFESKLPNGIKVNSSNKPILSNQYLKKLKLTQPVGVVFYISPLKKSINSLTEFLKIKVIDAIISGMRYPSGLLHSRLRGQELVYVVHTVPMKMGDQDFLFTYALTEPHQVIRVNKIISQSFKEIRTEISQEQLDLAKSQVFFDTQSSRQNPKTRIREYADNWNRFQRFPSNNEIEKVLAKITINDVKEVVNESFLRSKTIMFNAQDDKKR